MSLSQDVIARQLGKRLRSLRLRRGLTQEAVADKAGFTGKYVSEIERGLRDLPLSTVCAIVEQGLDTTLDEAFANLSSKKSTAKKQLPAPLPRSVREVAFQIAALPVEERRTLMVIVRNALTLTR